jgi:hypothetical protein
MNQRDCHVPTDEAPGRGGWEKGGARGDRSVGILEGMRSAFTPVASLDGLESFRRCHHVWYCGSNPGTSLKRMDNGRARQ